MTPSTWNPEAGTPSPLYNFGAMDPLVERAVRLNQARQSMLAAGLTMGSVFLLGMANNWTPRRMLEANTSTLVIGTVLVGFSWWRLGKARESGLRLVELAGEQGV